MSNKQHRLKEAAQGGEAAVGKSEQCRPPGSHGRCHRVEDKPGEEDGTNPSNMPLQTLLKLKSLLSAYCSAAGESVGLTEVRGTISRDYRGELQDPPPDRVRRRRVLPGSHWKQGAKGRIPPRSLTNGSLLMHIRTSCLPVTF